MCVTDANNNKTSYVYDDHGRVIKTTNAMGLTAEATYDISGNILTSTDFAGKLTMFTYDALDRVSSKTTADDTVYYKYSSGGKLIGVQNASGTTEFAYNDMDGLSRISYPDGRYVEYAYDNIGRLTAVSTEYSKTSYEYDVLSRLTKVIDKNGYATVYEYDANGNRSAVKYAGDKPIIVDKAGNVLDGHHRLRFAIENNKPVNISEGY